MTGLSLAVFLLAQAAPVAPDTEVRALTVTVLDETGGPVNGLGREDVAISENGVLRDITSFRPDRRPLTVAVIVDTSQAAGTEYRLNVVDAVTAFVSRLPTEETRYSIWTTGDRPEKLLDYTQDPAEASKALGRVAPRGGNYMLDALAESAEDLAQHKREGDRTAIVAISGMGPEFSYLDKWRSSDVALENADLFLALQVDVGGATFEDRADLSFVFDRLADASGGAYDLVLSYLGLDSGLRKLSPYLKAGYRLAYATVPGIKKRKIEVTVAQPETEVRFPAQTDVLAGLDPES